MNMQQNIAPAVRDNSQANAEFEKLLADIALNLANASEDRFDVAMNDSLQKLIQYLGFDRCTLVTLSERENICIVTHSSAVQGVKPLPKGEVVEIGPWYICQIRSGHIVRLSSAADLPAEASAERKFLRKQGFKSNVTIPLIADENVIGGAAFSTFRKERQWPEPIIYRLRLVGEILALGIRRHQYAQQLKTVLLTMGPATQNLAKPEAEIYNHLHRIAVGLMHTEHHQRRRMAELLHEDVMQILSSIAMFMETAKEVDLDKRSAAIARADELFQRVLQKLQELAIELEPEVLSKTGIVEGIRWLASQMQQIHGLTIEVSARGDIEPVSENARLFLYDAVRKLLDNVAAHSKTKQARLEIYRPDPGHVRLLVSDQGAGFDPAILKEIPDVSFGLFSIREQAKFFDGSMELQTSPGKGTLVSLTVPA